MELLNLVILCVCCFVLCVTIFRIIKLIAVPKQVRSLWKGNSSIKKNVYKMLDNFPRNKLKTLGKYTDASILNFINSLDSKTNKEVKEIGTSDLDKVFTLKN